MPKLQDPAICTPERARAVSALHWLGVVQILFAVGIIVFYAAIPLLREYDRNVTGTGSSFVFHEFVGTLLAAFFPAFFGVLAVMEAVYTCRWHREAMRTGNPSLIGSLFMLFICWMIFFQSVFGMNPPLSTSLSRCLFGVYLCVASVLAIMATLRCNRLRAQEKKLARKRSASSCEQ